MKKQRLSTDQIVVVLKQAEMGLPVKDLIRQIGITEQTFCRRKRQYGVLKSDQVRELKQVVEEEEGLALRTKRPRRRKMLVQALNATPDAKRRAANETKNASSAAGGSAPSARAAPARGLRR